MYIELLPVFGDEKTKAQRSYYSQQVTQLLRAILGFQFSSPAPDFMGASIPMGAIFFFFFFVNHVNHSLTFSLPSKSSPNPFLIEVMTMT